jgi:hypothetical protein
MVFFWPVGVYGNGCRACERKFREAIRSFALGMPAASLQELSVRRGIRDEYARLKPAALNFIFNCR